MTLAGDGQTCLFDKPELIAPGDEMDREVTLALAWHDGDARAAIAALIEDCVFLRAELAAAELLLSKGYGRGWVPRMERQS